MAAGSPDGADVTPERPRYYEGRGAARELPQILARLAAPRPTGGGDAGGRAAAGDATGPNLDGRPDPAGRGAVTPTILVVHGRSSFAASGAAEILAAADGLSLHQFSELQANPQLESVLACRRAVDELQPAAVLAVGGGSAMDTAKAALALPREPSGEQIEEVFAGGIDPPADNPVLIAAPTTAGSGAEATHFAVVYRGARKYSLAHPRLRPAAVILDPDLIRSTPRAVTIASGADAVCQCVESFWNRNATAESRAIAVEGLGELLPSYIKILEDDDAPVRAALLRGANLAGRAIDLTKTTAGHALSYGLTTGFGVPHGLAVLAVMQQLIPVMVERHGYLAGGQRDDGAGAELDTAFAGLGSSFPDAFDALAEAVWRAHSLAGYFDGGGSESRAGATRDATERESEDAGIPAGGRTGTDSRVAELAAGVNVERLANHPVHLDEPDIREIYRRIIDRHAA